MALHSMKMARFNLKTNLGLEESTSTASIDACIRRLQHLRADLRKIQMALCSFVKHQRAAFDAGHGFVTSLRRFYAYASTKARLSSSPPILMPELGPLDDLFRSGTSGPPLVGVLEHVLEGIQVGVGSELEKWANELAALEASLEDLKNGALKKSHDYYLKKITDLEAKQSKKAIAATEAVEAAEAAAHFAAMAADAEREQQKEEEREAQIARESGAEWASGSSAGASSSSSGALQRKAAKAAKAANAVKGTDKALEVRFSTPHGLMFYSKEIISGHFCLCTLYATQLRTSQRIVPPHACTTTSHT